MPLALVVDDQEENRYLLEALLGAHGYEVRVACNGSEALACARAERPDIVISDILMPVMDGFTLCRQWKNDDELKKTPFVFYTATYTDSKDERLALSLGADRFLVKPAEPDAFMRIVEDVLEQARRGQLQARDMPPAAEVQYLREYNAVLVHKLESKLTQLEAANRTLAAKDAFNEAVLNATSALIAVVGMGGEIQTVNRAWSQFFEHQPQCPRFLRLKVGEDAFAQHDREEVDDSTSQLRAGLRAVLGGEKCAAEFEVPVGLDCQQWLEVRIESVAVAGAGALVACIDITERKKAETTLAEAARRKDAFLAMLGHELRNPLAPIRTACSILKRLSLGDGRAERARDIIDRQTSHLARMVDDLLDLSRIERDKLVVADDVVDLADTVRATAEGFRSGFESRQLTFRLDVPAQSLWVRGEAVRLAQVLYNLLHNSLKFTEPGGRVEVRLSADGDSWCRLVVRDTGVGMDPEFTASVFQPFEQAPQGSARVHGGLGLGLPLVKGLVDLHGGQVWGTSAGPGRGSEFLVRLPLTDAPSAREWRERSTRTLDAKGARVLVIEDNTDAASSLQGLVELAGGQVRVAHDGDSGLSEARSWLPDTILCDIGLPGPLDGYGVAEAIRADPTLRRIRLVALTGYGQANDKDHAKRSGFDFHLTKPADPQQLLQLVATAQPQSSESR